MAPVRDAARAPLAASVGAASLPRIPVAAVDREHAALRNALESAVAEVFRRARFVLGPEVEAFESELAAYLGGGHVVGCGSGTDALVLALRALDIGAGDEVIVPAFTFAATAEAVVLVGASPVFADIEPDTFAIDARSAATLIGPRTRAIIPVHLYGQCARMAPLRDLAARSSLRIVEDAAQAAGARLGDQGAGTLGDVAAFSFYPTKNLGGSGDGGAVTTADPRLAERLRRLRVHGRRDEIHESIGLNSRLDELQAAVLRVKLRHLDGWNDRRRANAARYRAAIGPGITAPAELEGGHHVYHQFTVRTPRRADLVARLDAAGIASAVYYPRALHEQPAYARWARGSLPEAESAAAEVLSVPVHPWLSEAEIERVAAALGAGG
jgi:dTDP-4-amino-4,6-dideoxygalactose transaminase